MLDDSELIKIFDNKVVLGHINYKKDMSKTYKGILSINSSGDGFIKSTLPTGQEIEYYVYRKNLMSALKNDEVEFVKLIKETKDDELEEVAITNILKRNKEHLVATVNIDENNELKLIPDDLKFYLTIKLNNNDNLKNGNKLLLKILKYIDNFVICDIEKNIGNINEIVIDNTIDIVNSIDLVLPLQSKLFPPNIDGVNEKVEQTVYENAYNTYGRTLPDIVQTRINKELKSIISNGYSVVYWISHLLVKKSINDGYVVGSRGSVGSSLVATFLNITDVNPLQPHYLCSKCKYSNFDIDLNIYIMMDMIYLTLNVLIVTILCIVKDIIFLLKHF